MIGIRRRDGRQVAAVEVDAVVVLQEGSSPGRMPLAANRDLRFVVRPDDLPHNDSPLVISILTLPVRPS